MKTRIVPIEKIIQIDGRPVCCLRGDAPQIILDAVQRVREYPTFRHAREFAELGKRTIDKHRENRIWTPAYGVVWTKDRLRFLSYGRANWVYDKLGFYDDDKSIEVVREMGREARYKMDRNVSLEWPKFADLFRMDPTAILIDEKVLEIGLE